MKTVLYYTQTKLTIIYPNGYEIDGVNQSLGEIATGIWHLEYVPNGMPNYDNVTEFTSYEWIPDYDTNQYIKVWTIHEKENPNWKYPDWSKRIVAPIELVMDDVGVKMAIWFSINGFPIEKVTDTTVHLYCNVILPEHQTIVDNLGDLITIEDKIENS